MKNIKTLCFFILIVTLNISCKKESNKKAPEVNNEKIITKPVPTKPKTIKPKKELKEIVINLKYIKSRKSVVVNKRKMSTQKTAIYTAFSDSLDVLKKTFLNNKPTDETIIYKIPKNDFINFTVDATLEKYNYFLKAGDSLTINFNKKGFVSKSYLNGNENDASLLFSKNSLPIREIEYVKLFKKTYGRVNDKVFEINFNKKFQKEKNKALKKIEKSKDSLPPIIYKALKKHLAYTDIKNDLSKGINQNIPHNDFAMSINAYRDLTEYMLLKISDISYLDDEKLAIEESMEVTDFLINNDTIKTNTKTRYMIMRELIKKTGHYEPNLIPELIAKIPNTTIKEQYIKTYTSQYLLELKEYQNDSKNLNLISIKSPKKVFSFQNFLNQHKGKVIYVDLWASWCAPCRKQLEPSNKLQKELAKHPIVFSFFSTDKSFAQWKTAQIEEQMENEPNSFLILNTKRSNRYNSWEVRGIPRYLIFDKTGKLVVKDAPTPSDPNIKEVLLKYVN